MWVAFGQAVLQQRGGTVEEGNAAIALFLGHHCVIKDRLAR
jgi:hypothetical protein